MKLIKYLVTLLMVLTILLGGGLVMVLLLVDPNEYKPEIVRLVNEQTGRELAISGDLSLSVFPWIGLKLGETTLSNAAGFDAKSFAELKGVDIKVAFMPLLRGEVTVGVIRLKGLTVNLARRKDGQSNWDDLIAANEADEVSADGVSATDATTKAAPDNAQAVPVRVGGVEVIDANIVWQDEMDDMRVDLQGFNFKTGEIQLGQAIDFKTDFILKNKTPKLQVKADIAARVSMDEAFEKIGLQNVIFDFEIDEVEVLGGTQRISGKTNLALDLPRQRYSVEGLTLKADLQGRDLPSGAMSFALQTSLDADLVREEANIKSTQLQVFGLDIQTQLQAKNILGDVHVDGHINLAAFSPRELLVRLAMADTLPVTADQTVLGHVQMAADFNGGLESVALSTLTMTLDDTQITGSMAIAQLSKTPSYTSQLVLDAIDLDRYLPPALEQEAAAVEPVLSGDEPIELPIELMRELNMDASLKIGQLQMMGMTVSQFDAGLKATAGVIDLVPMNLDLYQGNYRGAAHIDVRDDRPLYTINMNLNGVQSEPLLDDFMEESPVTGMMNLAASLTTGGDTVNKFKQSLNGDATFEFKDGSLKGFNAAEKMREVRAKLRREKYQPNPGAKRTDFAEFFGSINIVNGIATFTESHVSAPALRGFIKKSVNLINEQLDLRVELYIVDTKTGQDGKALEELKDVFIPLDVTGPFTDPSIKLDFKAMMNQENRAELEAKKARARAESEAMQARARAELVAKKQQQRKAIDDAKREKEAAFERKKAEEKAALEEKAAAEEEALKQKLQEKKKKFLDRFKG